jgi:hypothetical protein
MKTLLIILAIMLPAASYAGDLKPFQLPPIQSFTLFDNGNTRAVGSINPQTGDVFILDLKNNDIITEYRDSWGNITVNRWITPGHRNGIMTPDAEESHDSDE